MHHLRTAAAAVAGLAVLAPAAMGHAGLSRSNPAANARVHALPTTITLTFSDVMARAGKAVVTRNGVDYARGASLNPRNARQVRVRTTGGTRRGLYRVTWIAVHVDGHSITGTFSFRVV